MAVPSIHIHLPSVSLSEPPSQMSARTAVPESLRFLLNPARKLFSAWLLGIASVDFLLRTLHCFWTLFKISSYNIHCFWLRIIPELRSKLMFVPVERSSNTCHHNISIYSGNICWEPGLPAAPWSPPGWCWCWSASSWSYSGWFSFDQCLRLHWPNSSRSDSPCLKYNFCLICYKNIISTLRQYKPAEMSIR